MAQYDRQVLHIRCFLTALSALTPIVISINGGNSVVVAQPSTYSGTVTLSVPVLVHLNSGSNTVTIGAGQSSE